ncbi:unnamed protein product [Acanthoscelides obtectus]|uniref:Uncharacterized protein n=1 Tax=Acanthoscelides obtectus TaxID=200917 RepID=A0A9P0LG65_ACAOB|nr:unnamed protein product [Acanthoscelides obtectus]CAK1683243.1 hypothetical protein AOBTE_LOCUS34160 [Acanthoscelides obtectus]
MPCCCFEGANVTLFSNGAVQFSYLCLFYIEITNNYILYNSKWHLQKATFGDISQKIQQILPLAVSVLKF